MKTKIRINSKMDNGTLKKKKTHWIQKNKKELQRSKWNRYNGDTKLLKQNEFLSSFYLTLHEKKSGERGHLNPRHSLLGKTRKTPLSDILLSEKKCLCRFCEHNFLLLKKWTEYVETKSMSQVSLANIYYFQLGKQNA